MGVTVQAAKELYQSCVSLLIYQPVFDDDIGQAFLALLQSLDSPIESLKAYSRWFSALVDRQLGWRDYLILRMLSVETALTRQIQQPDLPPQLLKAIEHDLRLLQQIYYYSSEQICDWVSECAQQSLVAWSNHRFSADSTRQIEALRLRSQLEQAGDWATMLPELIEFYRSYGAGLFAQYDAFRWQNGRLVAIGHPDSVDVETLVGYESQRDTLIKNTEFLLAGLPALHILLYGSRGSGKSSLVKSLLQRYRDRHLRLIEVGKSALNELPSIVEQLRGLPQKFVIFVDDLSFEEDDDAFKALKVVLEGNLTARPPNVVVYATSNRRHLIREYFDDRPRPKDADEVHHWDTVQEKLSFSDRFGLTLTFEPADQTTYLKIVHHLAQHAEITLSTEELDRQALQWATRHNGRSGRTARQFVDFLKSDLMLS